MAVGVQVPLRVPNAGIAQLVEHDLAKVGVASSSLVSRSSQKPYRQLRYGFFIHTALFTVYYCILPEKSFNTHNEKYGKKK